MRRASPLLFAVAAVVGCHGSAGRDAAARGDDVVVDFYRDGSPSAACAGTLVSSRVVLTAAHCADASEGARVTVAGDSARTAEVAEVISYDWTDDAVHHDKEHDIVLLVLRASLDADAYGHLSTDDAFGTVVSLVRRTSQAAAYGDEVERVDGAVLAREPPPDLPFAALTSVPIAEAGGAVRRADGALVGVAIGTSADRGPGYAASVNDPDVALWLEQVIGYAAAEATTAPSFGSDLLYPEATPGDAVSLGGGAAPTLTPAGPKGVKLVKNSEVPLDYTRKEGLTVLNWDMIVDTGANYWRAQLRGTDDLPGDDAVSHGDSLAQSYSNYSFLFTHGNAGVVARAPPLDEINSLVQGNRTLILGACYGGAPSGGKNNAARIAHAAGVAPQRVWGCTGMLLTYASSLDCGGKWVDGTGAQLVRTQGSFLEECTLVKNGTGYYSTNCH
jgi:hypothetical protein